MSLHLEPVKVATRSADQEGQLVFEAGFLVAVLVRLADFHEDAAGKWFLEADFGRIDELIPPVFDSLEIARDWIERRLSSG